MRKSKHNLNHYHLTTMSMGELVPIGVTEVLPGDTFRHATSALIRYAPLVYPVMHPVHVKVHHWFVPNRLVWSDWEGFITGSNDAAEMPTVTQDGNSELLDAMGVAKTAVGTEVSALAVRAYNMIANEFYRDQDLQDEEDLDSLDLRLACWEKDYFSTARPAPQEGDPISIPFSAATAPIAHDGANGSDVGVFSTVNDANRTLDASTAALTAGAGTIAGGDAILYADLSQASGGILVSDYRTSIALQRFSEARSRFGKRYVDYLRYLGVRPSDGRLDRPEYLGGGRQTISFSEVLATAETGGQFVGSFGGHGIAAVRSRPYRRFFEEHGFVISLLVVRPRAIYGQQLNRHYLRRAKEDYWQKELEIIGQQPVTVGELYPESATPGDTFGWVDRYLEYRGQPSYVSRAFREAAYDDWHLARIFGSDPALNASFVECDASNRIFAAPSEPQLLVMAQHFITARRLVSKRART